jgi:hypothetical protein
MTKNRNKINLFDIPDSKEIVSVVIIIAITGMMIYSAAFVNPSWAKSSKHEDKAADKKAKPTTTTTNATTTPSSSTERSDYKNFQKCLSTATDKQGFATKTDIQNCFKPIYSPTISSSIGTNSSTPASFNQVLAPNSNQNT